MSAIATRLVILTEHGTTARINSSEFDPRFHRDVLPEDSDETAPPLAGVQEVLVIPDDFSTPVAKPRGRPKGSKNKTEGAE